MDDKTLKSEFEAWAEECDGRYDLKGGSSNLAGDPVNDETRDKIWFPEAGDRIGCLEVTAVDKYGIAYRDHEAGSNHRCGLQVWRRVAQRERESEDEIETRQVSKHRQQLEDWFERSLDTVGLKLNAHELFVVRCSGRLNLFDVDNRIFTSQEDAEVLATELNRMGQAIADKVQGQYQRRTWEVRRLRDHLRDVSDLDRT